MMKRGLTLLLASMMLVFALTACGGRDKTAQDDTANQNDSAVMDGGAANNGGNGAAGGSGSGGTNGSTNSGNGSNSETGANNGTGANKNDSLLDDAGDVVKDGIQNAENAIDGMTGDTKDQAGGVSYGRMMRNGRVHDTDGVLTDHENSATPGTTF